MGDPKDFPHNEQSHSDIRKHFIVWNGGNYIREPQQIDKGESY